MTDTLFDPYPEISATQTPPGNHLNVVGIDPSLTGTGVASTLGWCGRVGRDGVTTLPLRQRVDAVDGLVEEILTLVGTAPALVVIEQPAFSRFGAGSVERHALWWLVVRSLMRRELPVAEVTTRGRMLYATGKGAVTKGAVIAAVTRRWPQFDTGGDDNLADAIVLAAMGADYLGQPLGAGVPAVHRKALAAVRWPEVPLRAVA